MCKFCIQHGDGKKWYLSGKNYIKKLAASNGRESFITDFFKNYEYNYRKNVYKVDIANRLPFIRKYAEIKVRNYFTEKHAGQVVSLEDAISICGLAGRVSVIECPCRKYLYNKKEKECILFGTTAEIVENLPEFSHLTDLGSEDSAELLESIEAKGKIHTIWTFITPYIGAICNCDKMECLMFHLKNQYKIAETIREGHEKALINQTLCIGCGACQKICQFKAITINEKKAKVGDNCYGCGVCRGFCPNGAIQLTPRVKFGVSQINPNPNKPSY